MVVRASPAIRVVLEMEKERSRWGPSGPVGVCLGKGMMEERVARLVQRRAGPGFRPQLLTILWVFFVRR